MKYRKWSNSLLHLRKVEMIHGEISAYFHLLNSIALFLVFTFTAKENERYSSWETVLDRAAS
jgi:hypothetical protein